MGQGQDSIRAGGGRRKCLAQDSRVKGTQTRYYNIRGCV